jgi:hypothetical protein
VKIPSRPPISIAHGPLKQCQAFITPLLWIYPVGNSALLGFEPLGSVHSPEDVNGSERLEVLTGFTFLIFLHTPKHRFHGTIRSKFAISDSSLYQNQSNEELNGEPFKLLATQRRPPRIHF